MHCIVLHCLLCCTMIQEERSYVAKCTSMRMETKPLSLGTSSKCGEKMQDEVRKAPSTSHTELFQMIHKSIQTHFKRLWKNIGLLLYFPKKDKSLVKNDFNVASKNTAQPSPYCKQATTYFTLTVNAYLHYVYFNNTVDWQLIFVTKLQSKHYTVKRWNYTQRAIKLTFQKQIWK